jgi:formiminotetrahydrofolate cyclodeaminase
MVCRLSPASDSGSDIDRETESARARFATARETLLRAAGKDEAAYGAFRAASALPKTNEPEKATRREAMQAALIGAAIVPMAIARASRDLLPDLVVMAAHGNRHVRSDAVIAGILATAAVRASQVNVCVNTAMLRDRDRASELDREVEGIVADAIQLAASLV